MIRLKKQRGTAMVEFALILPVFLLLSVGGMCMLMAFYTYGNVSYIAQQVAQCRANYLLGGAGAASSPCPGPPGTGPTAYATTLGTAMGLNSSNFTPAVAESQGVPCSSCVQEQVSYAYTPIALIPAFTMSQTAVAAVTMYSGTIGPVAAIAINANDCLPAPAATVAIPGVTTSMVATASPVIAQDPHIVWDAYVDPAGGQVDLNICNLSSSALTTTATSYNVRVIP